MNKYTMCHNDASDHGHTLDPEKQEIDHLSIREGGGFDIALTDLELEQDHLCCFSLDNISEIVNVFKTFPKTTDLTTASELNDDVTNIILDKIGELTGFKRRWYKRKDNIILERVK